MRSGFVRPFVALLGAWLSASAGCVPYRNPPLGEIERLGSLSEVMDAQSTIVDSVITRIGETSYGDNDWAAFRDVSERIRATAERTKMLGAQARKPARFAEMADTLRNYAIALGRATDARDADLASQALTDIKGTCKSCHTEFR